MSGRSGRGNQNFNSLPHTEVDTGTYFTKIIPKTFQLTTSHRGRPSEALLYRLYGTYFNSLPHTEVDISKIINMRISVIFQLTTSHRGRRGATHKRTVFSYFNSLPHTEVDQYLSGIRLILYISTHYLTQR